MFDFITGLINAMGALGVGLLMLLENVFPPIPSELIMPLAGFNAAQGTMSLALVILLGSLGSLLGAWFWYWLGAKFGKERLRRLAERHGRWVGISPEELNDAEDWFERNGGRAVMIGRLVPTIRTLISIPAGINGMPLGLFLAYSAVGTLVWTALLTLLGYWLESQYTLVEHWLNPVSTIVVIGIVALYLWRVVTYDRRRAKRQAR